MKRNLLFFLFFVFGFNCFAQQDKIKLTGFVLSELDSTALPYATIYNKSTNKGSISNEIGYFEIELVDPSDSIFISYIGFTKQLIPFTNKTSSYYLKEDLININTVKIVAEDESYLLDLIVKTRENQNEELVKSKAYYELKSYINQNQIELVENFYNAEISGYDLDELYLKAGRVGLRKTNERLFMSLESSKAISRQPIFNGSSWFPTHPLHLSKRKIKKLFYYELDKKYLDDQKDTVLLIHLFPKYNKQSSFETWIWLKPTKNQILKLKFKGKNLQKQPFIPLFEGEKIENVNLHLVKTFQEIDSKMVLKHIDFKYDFDYINRGKETYHVNTKALIENYDFDKEFNLPYFEYPRKYLNDYRKIQALPYNDFFWNNHTELSLKHQLDSNKQFLSLLRTLKIQELFTSRDKKSGYVFESVYVPWSGKRILIREYDTDSDTTGKPLPYQLKAKLFLDSDIYDDSTSIMSAMILDPYDSYFKVEMDSIKNCFVNMYFDLMEIERLKMMEEIKQSDRSIESLNKIYHASLDRIRDFEYEYFTSAEGGHNEIVMRTYNQMVRDKLGIDNIEIFQVFK